MTDIICKMHNDAYNPYVMKINVILTKIIKTFLYTGIMCNLQNIGSYNVNDEESKTSGI